MSRYWLLAALFVSGCLTEDNVAQKTVAVYCARAEECDKGNFENAYTSQTDCRESLLDDYQKAADCQAQWCTFDPEAAGNCLSGARSVGCDDWSQGDFDPDCDDVYTDCDMVNLTLCYVS
jgi:hypothetical protein